MCLIVLLWLREPINANMACDTFLYIGNQADMFQVTSRLLVDVQASFGQASHPGLFVDVQASMLSHPVPKQGLALVAINHTTSFTACLGVINGHVRVAVGEHDAVAVDRVHLIAIER